MKIYSYLLAVVLMAQVLSAQPTWQSFYKTLPDVKYCKAGAITDEEQQKLLYNVNKIRKIHGLQPLVYKPEGFAAAMEASLISVANATINHNPEKTAECFTDLGYTGCSKSNLHISTSSNEYVYPSELAVIGWLIDNKSLNAQTSAGHRRSILNPFVNGVAFGRVDGNPKVAGYENRFCIALSMKYDYNSIEAVGLQNDFVAYPYQNYPPSFVDKSFYLSFMAVPDKKNVWANQNIDFSAATITMKTEAGASIAVSGIVFDNTGWGGFPNAIHWKAAGLQDQVKYLVEIKNVKYKDEVKEYSYWFKLTDEALSVVQAPVLTLPANAAKDLNTTVDFKWESVTNADSYELIVSESSNFATSFATKKITTNAASVTGLVKGKTYYWKVRAMKGADYSNYSEVRSFAVAQNSVPVNVLFTVYPAKDETGVDYIPTFKWSKVNNANYDLQVGTTEQFTATDYLTVNEINIKDTTYTVKKDLYKKKMYYWRVRARFPASFGEWTEISKFTTGSTTNTGNVEIADGNTNTLNISIVPAPVKTNTFDINFISPASADYLISIFDISGKEVISGINYYADGGNNSYKMQANLPNGSYILILTDGQQNKYSYKFNVSK